MLSRIVHYAESLSGVPNAPFLHGPMLRMILKHLSDMEIPHVSKTSDLSRGSWAADDYCLYVRFKRGRTTRPLLIDSHTDHPAFVLDGKGQAIAFGSVGFARIGELLKGGPIDMRVFGPDGNFLSLCKLTDFKYSGKPTARIQAPVPIPANSHGLWNVTDFMLDGAEICMNAADNMIVTNLMLTLIEQVALYPNQYPNLDVTFAFTFLEEVFEVSATALASARRTPFDTLDDQWIVVVLESMQAVPLLRQEQLVMEQTASRTDLRELRLADDDKAYSPKLRSSRLDAKAVHDVYQAFGLALPDHDAGVLIKINDTDCAYGYEFADQPNLAEILLLTVADELGIRYQHTVSGGACNGTAYSLFPTSSNVVTLCVPNPLKHNINWDGNIVPERVRITDVEAASEIMRAVLSSMQFTAPTGHSRALGLRLKGTSLVPSPFAAARLRAERSAVAWSVQPRLRSMRYFPENPIDELSFLTRRVLARVRERLPVSPHSRRR